jgi:hypothetical protein
MIAMRLPASEELDYIINYDIMYRMGRDGGDGEDCTGAEAR